MTEYDSLRRTAPSGRGSEPRTGTPPETEPRPKGAVWGLTEPYWAMTPIALLAVRGVFVLYSVAVAIYCVMAYLPFTYHQVLACSLIPPLNAAARMQPWIHLGATGLLLVLLIDPWRRGGQTRWIAAGLGMFQTISAGALVVHPVLAGLADDGRSFAWALVALLPPLWLAAAGIAAESGLVEWGERPSGAPHFSASWRCGLFVFVLYGAMAVWRTGSLAPAAAGASLLIHLLASLGVCLVLDWILRLAALFRAPARVEFWLCQIFLAAAISAMAAMVFCPAVGFRGWQAWVFSMALGAAAASQNAAAALNMVGQANRLPHQSNPASDGVALALTPAALGLAGSARARVPALAVLFLAGGFLAIRTAAMDWNFLFQQVVAACVWLVAFACFYGLGGARVRPRGMAWMVLPLALAAGYRLLDGTGAAAASLTRWEGYDASVRLARAFLAKPAASGAFYQFLGRYTNIPASVRVEPAEVSLAGDLAPSAGPLPHIFIITIDSLRRDYLSVYNPAVTFTPSIAAFARESTVFRNASTRYGGTGLSEPAIWAGALLPHKQYVQPFAPMNSLEKLLRAERYQMLLSRDSILAAILSPDPETVEIDPPETYRGYDLANSLERIQREVERRAGEARPIFAYTQPQNIHIAVIQREGAASLNGESYPGFYAPYASRLARVDAAFGKFIAFLKEKGIYQRSIVILTADHGDSLGEEGRWGHAYTLFPEIVRVPLIVHLPADLAARYTADPEAPAFSTDITPSLYYLLGHRPMRRHELFGSPLFTGTAAERARDPRAHYLIAASYGAVYGMLSGDGRRMYVADGVNYRNYLFEWDASGARTLPVSESVRQEQEDLIRKGILSIYGFYHFSGSQQVSP